MKSNANYCRFLRSVYKLPLTAVVTSFITLVPPSVMASSDDQAGIPSLRGFIKSVRSAEYVRYAARTESKVADENAFAEMKAYILRNYENVDIPRVENSFADENGSIFDCMPVEQQPALKGSPQMEPNAPEPPQPKGKASTLDDRQGVNAPRKDERKDQYGNICCTPGTIPMQRITLETLTRFKTLQDFFRK